MARDARNTRSTKCVVIFFSNISHRPRARVRFNVLYKHFISLESAGWRMLAEMVANYCTAAFADSVTRHSFHFDGI